MVLRRPGGDRASSRPTTPRASSSGRRLPGSARCGAMEPSTPSPSLVASAGPALVDRVADATPAGRMHGWSGAVGLPAPLLGSGLGAGGRCRLLQGPDHHAWDDRRSPRCRTACGCGTGHALRFARKPPSWPNTSALGIGFHDDMFNVTEAVAAYDWELRSGAPFAPRGQLGDGRRSRSSPGAAAATRCSGRLALWA